MKSEPDCRSIRYCQENWTQLFETNVIVNEQDITFSNVLYAKEWQQLQKLLTFFSAKK